MTQRRALRRRAAISHPYVTRAEKYGRDVLDGKIPACRHIINAVRRHFLDLEKQGTKGFPFIFDPEKAEQPCRFIEGLPHTKGVWAQRREKLLLSDWECFLICVLFGWLQANNGLRRFREAYLEIPRKNGKSPLAAGIGLYMWSMDGEAGAEVYSGATTRDQAWKVFGPAKLMLENTPQLQDFVGAQPFANSLVIEKDNSVFKPLIGKPGDGDSPSCAIIDEWHEHDTSEQVDTMKTGMLARQQPLLVKITTAGVNLAGPCYLDHIRATRVLDGVLQDEHLFALIYTIDDTDDWASPEAIEKANPNLGISVNRDILLAEQRSAVLNPELQNRFKTKHLNIWCAAKISWMPMVSWGLCASPQKEEDFLGEPCILSIDLASKSDLAGVGKLFERRLREGGDPHYYFFARFYLPEAALEEEGPNVSAYRKWRDQGWLKTTEGQEIDFGAIEQDVLDDSKRFQVSEVPYDPWRATQLAQRLTANNALCVELRQTVQNFSLPMKEVLSAVKSGRLHHDGNPVVTWSVSNVVAKTDAKDNIFPRKPTDHSHLKIDGAVLLIMCMARALAARPGMEFSSWINRLVGAKA